MITRKDLGFLGLEVTVTPDDDYEYLFCKNIDENSHFWVRRKDGILNFYLVEPDEWDERGLEFTKMRNKHQLNINIVTRETTIILPSRKQAYQELNKRAN